MKRTLLAFVFCLVALPMMSWFAEPASLAFMVYIFVGTAPVLIIRGLPVLLQARVNALFPFWKFAVRSLIVGMIIWIPPFMGLAYFHGLWSEFTTGLMVGSMLAAIGAAEASLFWLIGVWNNPAMTITSSGVR